jgi:hypothetical protein
MNVALHGFTDGGQGWGQAKFKISSLRFFSRFVRQWHKSQASLVGDCFDGRTPPRHDNPIRANF